MCSRGKQDLHKHQQKLQVLFYYDSPCPGFAHLSHSASAEEENTLPRIGMTCTFYSTVISSVLLVIRTRGFVSPFSLFKSLHIFIRHYFSLFLYFRHHPWCNEIIRRWSTGYRYRKKAFAHSVLNQPWVPTYWEAMPSETAAGTFGCTFGLTGSSSLFHRSCNG